MEKLVIGFEAHVVPDLNDTLDEAKRHHFDFIAVPLVHPRLRQDVEGISSSRLAPLTRSDLLLPSTTWTSCVIGKLSPWLNLDSPCERVRLASLSTFKKELSLATHLGLPAVLANIPIIPHPQEELPTITNYAGALHQSLVDCSYLQIWVRVPLMSVTELLEENLEGESCQWHLWNRLRSQCNHLRNLSVALELTENLPSDEELLRWRGEPIKAVIIPTVIFLTNKKGYPVLSQKHQSFVKNLIQYKVQFMLKGRARHTSGFLPYLQYLDHLRTQIPPIPEEERFSIPYNDYLQVPLQPLMDNLESQTYETFEKDPVKYRQYELAIEAALLDLPAEGPVTLMVVGAGRGPLVRAALRASESAKRDLRVFAVEKNPNAIITLKNTVISERWLNVTVIQGDMRSWKTDERADILVSELLGSFGDNELSPECLDGAQEFLKPGGISIPSEYTSYLAPIMSSKLWNDVRVFNDLKKFETAYVVKMHNYYQIAEAKACFKFSHPNPLPREKIDNRRYLSLNFQTKIAATLHGFAGYFHATLYKTICISIVPQTFSDGMFSWFPLYFPLATPMLVNKNDTIQTAFWRCLSPTKVWYEWSVVKPNMTQIHNANGHSYWIGL